MRFFCTYFDRNYLVRGMTLFFSLERHAAPFKLWVLCFDDFTYQALLNLKLKNLHPVSLKAFEEDDEALLAAKENRSRVEYIFTCTASLALYVLNNFPEVDLISYLDADLFFYSSPTPIYDELGNQSVLIIGHRFPEYLRHKEVFGIYNVGLLMFRNDQYGRSCLQWWRERCIEWCYDREEDGKFADQKYLDDWPTRFERVVVSQHKGANLAPWNWGQYKIQIQNGQALVEGEPLIFYHFHGLRILNRWLYDPIYVPEGDTYGPMPFVMRWWIYSKYIQALKETAQLLRKNIPEASLRPHNNRIRAYGRRFFAKKLIRGKIMINYGLK